MDSLETLCYRCVAMNLPLYNPEDCIQYLPNSIRTKIIISANRLYNGLINEDIMSALLHKDVKQLDLFSVKLTNTALQVISKRSPRLEKVVFNKAKYFFDKDGLAEFFKTQKFLNEIFITNCRAVDNDIIRIIANNCTNLDTLDVSGSEVDDDCMQDLVKMNLTRLNLARTKITDAAILQLGDSPLAAKLVDVNFSDCNITDDGIRHLNKGNLKYIGLEGCQLKDGLQCIADKLNLKYMSWTIQV